MTRIVIPVTRPVKVKELSFEDIANRFVRAPFFLIIEDEKERIERNIERALAARGIGEQVISELQPDVVIVKTIGAGAVEKLRTRGAKIYVVSSEKELRKVLKELGLI